MSIKHCVERINEHIPVRYSAWLVCVVAALLTLLLGLSEVISVFWMLPPWLLVYVGWRDSRQPKHAVLRNYPVIGHLRFLLEYIRPEMRQYFIESDTEAAPFSRAQRSLVYARAKNEPSQRPFGSLLDMSDSGFEWLNHAMRPTQIASENFRVTIGSGQANAGHHPCTQPYSASLFNISAMSFGALSANAVLALNQAAQRGGFYHDTGEGSISSYHLQHGGDLVWEIGSGYFGCRTPEGLFDPERFAQQAQLSQVKMIEIKLSQGAKPGHGGVLPAAKVTPEIAQTRGVMLGQDCISPSSHSSFSTPIELLQFVDQLRHLSGGKPTGFKLCIGHPWEWFAIVKAMLHTGITPDFIVVDGGEGGTGAAPVEFSDHVGVPLQEGLQLVHQTLVGAGLREHIRLGVGGKIISAFDMARVLALGADWCNSARGFMFALGCIQAQTCHSGRCPTGVTTQDPLRQQALHVPTKADRVQRFHHNTLEALRELLQAAGLNQPSDLTAHHIVQRTANHGVRTLATVLPHIEPGSLLQEPLPHHAVIRAYWPVSSPERFELQPEV